MHIGVFILLLLSGERNFGVRLNKPYSVRVPMDIPVFTGTHADFLIVVSVIERGVPWEDITATVACCACVVVCTWTPSVFVVGVPQDHHHRSSEVTATV